MDIHLFVFILELLSGNVFQSASSIKIMKNFKPNLSSTSVTKSGPSLIKPFVRIPVSQNRTEPKMVPKNKSIDQLAHAEDDVSVAKAIARKVKVLCWVVTSEADHKLKAVHVKNTWGRRCDILLFMSSVQDPLLPSMSLPSLKANGNAWDATKEAYRYIYQHHLYDAHWFLQADDTTYVVVENLRYMLLNYSTSDPVYFGSSIRSPPSHRKQVQAGLVLSRETVIRFIMEIQKESGRCNVDLALADGEQMTRCLTQIGADAVDSRDAYQRGRFFPLPPHHHLNTKNDNDWFWTNIRRIKTEAEGIVKITNYRTSNFTRIHLTHLNSEEAMQQTPCVAAIVTLLIGRDCCSEFAVTFHDVDPDLMYVLEYFVYHLRPFGIGYNY